MHDSSFVVNHTIVRFKKKWGGEGGYDEYLIQSNYVTSN